MSNKKGKKRKFVSNWGEEEKNGNILQTDKLR
jgi:hypothetical protein